MWKIYNRIEYHLTAQNKLILILNFHYFIYGSCVHF